MNRRITSCSLLFLSLFVFSFVECGFWEKIRNDNAQPLKSADTNFQGHVCSSQNNKNSCQDNLINDKKEFIDIKLKTPYMFSTNLDRSIENNKQMFDINNIEIGDHYILFNNLMTDKQLLDIKNMKIECEKNGDRIEDRNFGGYERGYDTGDNCGHSVVFMNDCFNNNDIYNYYKNIIIAGLQYLHDTTILQNSNNNTREDNNNDELGYHECKYVDNEKHRKLMRNYGFKHDWFSKMKYIENSESRVIEYITYKEEGTIGWHTDSESLLTSVSLMNNDNEFNGGELQFRSQMYDNDIERVNLKNSSIIVFPSYADHRVLPILSGQREVLVIEWWIKNRNYFIGRLTPLQYDKRVRHEQTRHEQRRNQFGTANIG